MMRKISSLVAAVALALILLPAPGTAAPIIINDFDAWKVLTGPYANVDLSGYSNFDVISAGTGIVLPYNETLSFNIDVQALQVPTGWNNWVGGRTPMVLWTQSGGQNITGVFGPPGDFPSAFGFFAEANFFGTWHIELVLPDGTVLGQDVTTPDGAEFFGWIGGAVTTFTVSLNDGGLNGGFAMAEFVKGAPDGVPVPEPSTLLLLGTAMMGLRLIGRKNRT